MNILELDELALRRGWGSLGEFWFSVKDFTIKEGSQLADYDCSQDMSRSEYLVSLGYIPYFSITSEEVIRAFVPTIENKKLKDKIENYNGSDYVDNFWKYFHIYAEISKNYITFEQKYIVNKAEEWCRQNGIDYELKVKL